jgi:hypothetical protein
MGVANGIHRLQATSTVHAILLIQPKVQFFFGSSLFLVTFEAVHNCYCPQIALSKNLTNLFLNESKTRLSFSSSLLQVLFL